jgi:glycosyltransferase involved in cell wall biosynthesis
MASINIQAQVIKNIFHRTDRNVRQDGTRKKAITIISSGIGKPSREEIQRQEENDLIPRVLYFEDTIGCDMLDEHFLSAVPRWRRLFYRFVPTVIAQGLEARFVRRHYDAVVTWSTKNVLLYGLLSKLTLTRHPHIAMMSWLSQPSKIIPLRFVQSHIDRIILWSSVQRDAAIRGGISRDKIVLVSRRADTKFWHPMEHPTDTVCAVGQEMRDYPTLITALDGIDVPCFIANGKFHSKTYESVSAINQYEQFPPNVTTRKLSYAELRALYARSRFVIVPLLHSDTDNGVNTIEESMAMGKAVICSRTQGQVDIIQEGKTGLFVPVGDSGALRQAILYLWNNPRIAEEMGKNGRAYIEQHHSLEHFVSEVNGHIEDVIQQYRR